MRYFETNISNGTATVTFCRGKVNAIDEAVVLELLELTAALTENSDITGLILTGKGRFFSFGFDVPQLYDLPREDFTRFLRLYCRLYHELFLLPKPLVAAVNGHATAGGCILALACDYRLMVDNNSKMALNEVAIGASLFAGVVAMLRYVVGNAAAEKVLLSGRMFTAREAHEIGLVNELTAGDRLMQAAADKVKDLGRHYGPGYAGLKRLIRKPVAEDWRRYEEQSIDEFVDIWYSPNTREKIKQVKIQR